MKKKILSVLLALVMALSLVPTAVFAAGGSSWTMAAAEAIYDRTSRFDHVDVRVNGDLKIITQTDGTQTGSEKKDVEVVYPVTITITPQSGTPQSKTFNKATSYEWRWTGLRVKKTDKITVSGKLQVTGESKTHDFTVTYQGKEDFVQAIYNCDGRQGLDFNIEAEELIKILTPSDEDPNFINVTKTFEGIEASQIPDDFTVTVKSAEKTYTLTDSSTDGVTLTKSEDGLTWNWKINDATVGTYTVSESGEDIPGYDVTTTGTGSITVAAAKMTINVVNHATTCSHKNWPVSGGTFFAATLTQGGVAVITDKSLSSAQRLAVQNAVLKINGPWKTPVYFYSVAEQMASGKGFNLNGATIDYNEATGEIDIGDTSYWQHVATLSYDMEEAAQNPEIGITNSYEVVTTSKTVEKVWKDNEDATGVRPGSVSVELYADGVATGEVAELNEDNGWKHEFTGLTEFDADGNEIVYTAKEVNVPTGYDVNESGLTVTNTIKTFDLTVTKAVKDAKATGLEGVSYSFTAVINGKTETFTLADGESKVFADLPYGTEYTVTESQAGASWNVDDAEKTGVLTADAEEVFTNSYVYDEVPADADLKIVKTDDQDQALAGAGFTVYSDKDCKAVVEELALTNADGMTALKITGLKETTTYYLKETTTPEGYLNNDTVYAVTFTDEGKWEVKTVADKGNVITWIANWIASGVSVKDNTLTVANTPIELTDVTVTKTWEDADNQDGIRPANITVTLTGKVGDSVVYSDEQTFNGSYTWKDLYKTDADGNEIVYSAAEAAVTGYKTSVAPIAGGVIAITNTHEPEQTTVTVTKAWSGDEDVIAKRPASVVVALLADDVATGATAVLSKDNSWTYTFTGLDKYAAGKVGVEAKYTVVENNVPAGYEVSYGTNEAGLLVTNTIDTIDLTVTKAVRGEGDTGLEAADYSFTAVINGETVTFTLADGESKVFEDLPYGTDYTVTEDQTGATWNVAEDVKTGVLTEDEEVVFVNSYVYDEIPADADLTIVKTDDQGKALAGAGFTVYSDADCTAVVEELALTNDQGVTALKVTGLQAETTYYLKETTTPEGYLNNYTVYAVTFTDEGEWKLVSTEDAGNVITWFAKWIASGEDVVDNTLTVANTPIELTEVTITKVWDDADNQDGIRPESITVELMQGETSMGTAELNEGNDWAYTFTDLYKTDADGNELVYTAKEIDAIDDYTTAYSDDTLTITNTHEVYKVDVTVAKEWNDADNQDGIRPDSITVELYANGEPTGMTLELNAENGWVGTFTDLDKNLAGEEIVYAAKEADVAGYEAAYSANDNGLLIVNTHEVEMTTITVVKEWVGDTAANRPDYITVQLLANGEKCGDLVKLTAASGWTYSWTVDKFAAGEEIEYVVQEVGVPEGYTSAFSSDGEGNFVITNTLIPVPVKTGDSFSMGLYMMLAMMAICAAAAMVVVPMKKQGKRQG